MPSSFRSNVPGVPSAGRAAATVALAAALAGCALGPGGTPAPRPEAVRARLERLMPASTPDRAGWAADIQSALSALDIEPTLSNLCAVLAVTEQETGYRVDPPVPGLGRIARAEIDRRAARLGLPRFAVDAALSLSSPDGRSWAERIDAARTERALSRVFEDLVGEVPLGKRLLGGWNPVRTGGPMQVGIAFAEGHARQRRYPYPMTGSVRDEVFTRRGGLYFGIAHLLDYPVAYDRPLYRFADFNAGRYASRNAAFQSAASRVSGRPLELDGDLLPHDDDRDARPGATELAVRAIGPRIGESDAAIRRALELGDRQAFEDTAVWRRTMQAADAIEGRPVPRAVVPRIALRSPKITRDLTTAWFADRVDARHRRCVERGAAAGTDADDRS